MLYAIRPDERVMLFVDLRNLVAHPPLLRRRHQGWELDFEDLALALAGPRNLRRSLAFDAVPDRENEPGRGESMVKALKHIGYETRLVPSDSTGPETQRKVNEALGKEMIHLANHAAYETAVVVSVDAQHVPAIRQVRSNGRRVEIAAWEGTYSAQLREAADRFHRLDDYCLLRYRVPRR